MFTMSKPSENRVDIALSGKLDAHAMREGLDELESLSQGVVNGRMLYTITDVSMPSLAAIGVEFGRIPKLFTLIGKFDKCAVLADAMWLQAAATVEGVLIPGLKIKAFDLDEAGQAEAWLAI